MIGCLFASLDRNANGTFGRMLPIAFLFPSATLSMEVVPTSVSAMQHVPNFDYTSLRHAAGLSPMFINDFRTGDYLYNRPSIEVQKIAAAVSAGGFILPIKPPALNSSWVLNFYGPSISCGAMNKRVQEQVLNNFADWYGSREDCVWHSPEYTYLAWSSNSLNSSMSSTSYQTPNPFIKKSGENSTTFSTGYYLGPLSPLYLVIMPKGMAGILRIQNCGYTGVITEELGKLVQCDLYNASYSATFDYETGSQSISLKVEQLEPVDTVPGVRSLYSNSQGCTGLTAMAHYHSKPVPCIFEPHILRNLSYTDIFDAFRRTILGSVAFEDDDRLVADSNIISTTLLDIEELKSLRDRINEEMYLESLQSNFEYRHDPRLNSLSSLKYTYIFQDTARKSYGRDVSEYHY